MKRLALFISPAVTTLNAVFFAIFIIFPTPAVSALTIRGTVIDVSSQPVSGALVTFTDVSNTEISFSDDTDESGAYSITILPTSIEDEPARILLLFQNYPNPFNPATVIPYSVFTASRIYLSIYNILGQKVRTLVDSYQPKGEHRVVWNGRDDSGNTVAAGIYIYRLRCGRRILTKKMVLIDGGSIPVGNGDSPASRSTPKYASAQSNATTGNTSYRVTITGKDIAAYTEEGVIVTEGIPQNFVVQRLPLQLTSYERDYQPYFSPDGKYIAFLSVRNTYNPLVAENNHELWIMNKDGSHQHPIITEDLYEGTVSISHVSWLKDSLDMLVQVRINIPLGTEIWRVALDGNKARLSSTGDLAERPEYSPDGLKIAFMIQGPNPPQGSPVYRLYVANINLSEPVLIEQGLIGDFIWKSDSQEIIYTLYDRTNENYELWKSSINGNERAQFSHTLDSEEDPSYSSDGNYIAFTSQNAVYITPYQTFQPKKLLDNTRNPKWIPNRNVILLHSEQSEQISDTRRYWTESWIVEPEGNILKKIEVGKATNVSFSSDGEYFVYSVEGNLWIDKLPK